MGDQRKEVIKLLEEIAYWPEEYPYHKDAAKKALDYIQYLLCLVENQKTEIFGLRYMPEVKRVYLPLDVPHSRGTTHGQFMQMQHEAETMHSNPPPDQPMG